MAAAWDGGKYKVIEFHRYLNGFPLRTHPRLVACGRKSNQDDVWPCLKGLFIDKQREEHLPEKIESFPV